MRTTYRARDDRPVLLPDLQPLVVCTSCTLLGLFILGVVGLSDGEQLVLEGVKEESEELLRILLVPTLSANSKHSSTAIHRIRRTIMLAKRFFSFMTS